MISSDEQIDADAVRLETVLETDINSAVEVGLDVKKHVLRALHNFIMDSTYCGVPCNTTLKTVAKVAAEYG